MQVELERELVVMQQRHCLLVEWECVERDWWA